jgi:hypothetical protein
MAFLGTARPFEHRQSLDTRAGRIHHAGPVAREAFARPIHRPGLSPNAALGGLRVSVDRDLGGAYPKLRCRREPTG